MLLTRVIISTNYPARSSLEIYQFPTHFYHLLLGVRRNVSIWFPLASIIISVLYINVSIDNRASD